MSITEKTSQIALTFVPNVGSVTARHLISHFGSAEDVFQANKKDLLQVSGIGDVTANNLLTTKALQRAEEEMEFNEKHGIQAVFYTDANFPIRLRAINDCPLMLFFKGSSLDLFSNKRVVAIVGTRQPSEYGKAICEELVEGFQKYKVLIVSGLAYGIDVTAHKKAVSLDMPNIGVLGHGLGRIYPETHKNIAQKMCENGGLLTEYPAPTPPDREHFPMRNRIIAGLSDALIVVETGDTGGSLISAHLANQYEREVFAVPGKIRDIKSIGCNYLIKTESARLVETVEDVTKIMKWDESGAGIQAQLFLNLSETEEKIVAAIRQKPHIPIDELSLTTGLSSGDLARNILALEFRGVIKTLPGKRYIVLG